MNDPKGRAKGLRIWVTRSEPGALRLAQALTAAGHRPWLRPVLEVQPLPFSPTESRFDLGIVLSAHGARLAGDALVNCTRVLSVGPATDAALPAAVVHREIAEQASSEGLVAWLERRHATHALHSVLLVRGEGGRDLVAQRVVQLGLRLTELVTYQRVPCAVTELVAEDIDAVAVSSADGLRAVHQAWRDAQGSPAVPVLVPSPRVADLARQLGYTQVLPCEGADPAAVIEALDRLNGARED